MTQQQKPPGRHGGRKAARKLEIQLPLPPEEAHEAERIWPAIASRDIRRSGADSLPGCIAMTLKAAPTAERRDLKDIEAFAIDALVTNGLVTDAESIVKSVRTWDRIIAPGFMSICLSQTTPPLQRIGAEARQANAERERRKRP